MAKRDQESDGAPRTESRLPTQVADQERLPARRSDYPLSWLRDEMEAMFDRFLGRGPAPRELGWTAGQFWNVDVEDKDKEVVVHAEAPASTPRISTSMSAATC